MLKKTKAVLNCSAGYMHVGMTFNKPFYGIVYADYDRNSACKMHGDGQTQAIIKLPLKGCGTVQVSTYMICVRFVSRCDQINCLFRETLQNLPYFIHRGHSHIT